MESTVGGCVICTQNLLTTSISSLPCGHTYHYHCILKWIRRSKRCPTCRAYTEPRHIVKRLYFANLDNYANTTNVDNRTTAVADTRSDKFVDKRSEIPSSPRINRENVDSNLFDDNNGGDGSFHGDSSDDEFVFRFSGDEDERENLLNASNLLFGNEISSLLQEDEDMESELDDNPFSDMSFSFDTSSELSNISDILDNSSQDSISRADSFGSLDFDENLDVDTNLFPVFELDDDSVTDVTSVVDFDVDFNGGFFNRRENGFLHNVEIDLVVHGERTLNPIFHYILL